ncbi:hypothetical protein GCM10027402_16320 [Arthrobacter monumenti]
MLRKGDAGGEAVPGGDTFANVCEVEDGEWNCHGDKPFAAVIGASITVLIARGYRVQPPVGSRYFKVPDPPSKFVVFRSLFETYDHIQRGLFGRNIKALVGRQMRRINGPDNARPNWSYSPIRRGK